MAISTSGLARRLGAVVPGKLTVADAVRVAMAEVDPVALRRLHRAAAPADGVGVLEDHDAPAVLREDRRRDEPGQVGADDRDVGVGLTLHGAPSVSRT